MKFTMVKQSVLWRNIEKHYKTLPMHENSTCKNTKYQCAYCSQIYASNVTRMSLHLMKDCPAPLAVKEEIRNIYTKSETSSGGKHFKLNARWNHVSRHYVKLSSEKFPNCKKDKYMCIYCNNRYANNVTRMGQHVMECTHCPSDVKNTFYTLNQPKNSSILARLPATFNMNSLEDDASADEFFYASDDVDPIDDTIEEKYDISQLATDAEEEGRAVAQPSALEIENIETTCSTIKMDVDDVDEEEIKVLISRACYATSIKLLENSHWQKVFNILASNYLPTQDELLGKYLDREYELIKNEVDHKIRDACKLSIGLCGIHKNKQLATIVVILTTPEPVVYDIYDINEASNMIKKIIEDNFKHNYIPICMKNCDELDFKSGYKCNRYILNSLKEKVHDLENIKPIQKWIEQITPDSCISSVVECFHDLHQTYSKNETFIYHLNEARQSAICNIHKAASLLDPRFKGDNLSPDEIIDGIEFINDLSTIIPDVQSDKIIYDIAEYRTKQGIWSKDFVWDTAAKVPAIIWWQSMCSSTELCKIATVVLNCPPVLPLIDESVINSDRKIDYVKLNLGFKS